MQEDKTQSFDLAQYVREQYAGYLKHGKTQSVDDDIPFFTPPEAKGEENSNETSKTSANYETRVEAIHKAIMEAKTGEAADKIFVDYAPGIATMSVEDRQKINTARKNRKALLKRGGAEAGA
jgi:hypothetical protein